MEANTILMDFQIGTRISELVVLQSRLYFINKLEIALVIYIKAIDHQLSKTAGDK